MKNSRVIKIRNTYYPYSYTELHGHGRLVVRLEVGRYPNGKKRYICVFAKSEEELAIKLEEKLKRLIVV